MLKQNNKNQSGRIVMNITLHNLLHYSATLTSQQKIELMRIIIAIPLAAEIKIAHLAAILAVER